MTTFKEYLEESKTIIKLPRVFANPSKSDDKVFQEWADKIAEECSEIVSIYKHRRNHDAKFGLYTKLRTRGASFITGTVDEKEESHLKKKFSKKEIKAIDSIVESRGSNVKVSNSLPCYTDTLDLRIVDGDLYSIYPKNGFEYFWLDDKSGRKLINLICDIQHVNDLSPNDLRREISNLFDAHNFSKRGISKAVGQNYNEIFITGDYYAVLTGSNFENILYKKLFGKNDHF